MSKLAATLRCEAGQVCKMRARSGLGQSGAECLSLRPGTCNVSYNGAAMNLRLMDQACGCSTVRGGQGLKVVVTYYDKVRARCCHKHSGADRVLVAPTRHLQCVRPPIEQPQSCHEAPTDGPRLRLLHHARRTGTQGCCRHTMTRCVLVAATSTRVQSACRPDQALAMFPSSNRATTELP